MTRVEILYELVKKDPGRSASSYTHQLGWGRGSAQTILANAEAMGILFCEDGGMIYPFDRLTPEQANCLGEVFDDRGSRSPHTRRTARLPKNYASGGNPRVDGYDG